MCLKNVNFEMRCYVKKCRGKKYIGGYLIKPIVISFEERIVDTRTFQMCF